MSHANDLSSTAMILAAGMGKRLEEITAHTPKPLLNIGGITPLDFIINQVKVAGFKKIIINSHYLAEQIVAHTCRDPFIKVSYEEHLLETAGGIRKVIDIFEDKPFLVVNGDILWRKVCPITSLMQQWQTDYMIGLLGVVPHERAIYFRGSGDFFLSSKGQLSIPILPPFLPYIYMGIAILKPQMFSHLTTNQVAPLGPILRHYAQRKELYGNPYTGEWCDIGHRFAFNHIQEHGFC